MLARSSKEKNHIHLVFYTSQVINDPLTGQSTQILVGKTSEEGSDKHIHAVANINGEVQLLPAGKVPHSHKIAEEIQPGIREPQGDDLFSTEKSDEEIVSTCRKMFEEVAEYEKQSREDAEIAEKFAIGDQWSSEDKAILREENRPCLTVNEIEAKLALLCGFQAQSATDARFYPVESTDNILAEISTQVVKNVFDRNNVKKIENDVFTDEVTVGRGLYHIRMDYNRNPLGDICIEKFNWRDAYIAPHEKMDLSDADYLFTVKVFPRSKAIKMFPEKEEEIKTIIHSAYDLQKATYSSDMVMKRVGDYDRENSINRNLSDVDASKQTLKIYTLYNKEYDTKLSVVDYDTGSVEEYYNINVSDQKKLEKMGLKIIKRIISNIRTIKFTGDILLENELTDEEDFPLIPVYAKYVNGNFWGKVKGVIDVQREINKRTSYSVDVIDRMSSFVYFIDGNTFEDQTQEEQFRANSMKTGSVFKVNDVARKPVKETGINLPAEVIQMAQISSQKMNLIMNIPMEAQGFASREISSVALVETRRSTMQANEYLYSNLADAKKTLAKKVIKMVQKNYTPERLERILISQLPPKDQTEMEKMMAIKYGIQQLFATPDLTNFDVAVEMSPTAPTIRSANFAFLLEMMRSGLPINPEIIIQASDLPNKAEILATFQQNKAQEQQIEQGRIQSEVLKTQISANSKQQIAAMKAGQPMPPQQGM